jgi:hypothetical protein
MTHETIWLFTARELQLVDCALRVLIHLLSRGEVLSDGFVRTKFGEHGRRSKILALLSRIWTISTSSSYPSKNTFSVV